MPGSERQLPLSFDMQSHLQALQPTQDKTRQTISRRIPVTDGDASPSSFYPRQHPLPRIFLTAPAYRPALRTPSFPLPRLFKAEEKKKLGPHAKKVSCSLLLFPSLLLVSAWPRAACATDRCPPRQTRRAGAGGADCQRACRPPGAAGTGRACKQARLGLLGGLTG